MRRLFLLVLVVVGLVFGGYHYRTMVNASHGVYLGMYAPGAEIDESTRLGIESQLNGKRVAIWHSFWHTVHRPGPNYVTDITTRGSIPMFTVQPATYTCQQLIAGAADADFQWWGAYVAQFKPQPIFLRYGHEMNIPSQWTGYPWNAERCGGSEQWKSWYRRAHDQIVAAGGTNALHVWCPNRIDDPNFDFVNLYPGDAYVDWACLDGYSNNPSGTSFHTVFNNSLSVIASLTSKPVMIGETGVSEAGDGGVAKATWIRDGLQTTIFTWPQVQALVWQHAIDGASDWRFNSTEAARLAFAESVASSRYLSTFGEPIPTPTPLITPTPTPTSVSTPIPTATPLAGNIRYLTDPMWFQIRNGWGPIEADRSNGESAAGDGRMLTIGGVPYAKGFGTHAPSEFHYTAPEGTKVVTGLVGMDDETPCGGAVFQIWRGNSKLYDSGLKSYNQQASTFRVNVNAGQVLRFVVDPAGATDCDHADWVMLRFEF